MMCYKDMTFCSGDGCTAFDRCDRALTDKVREDAARWWGGDNAPIAQFLNPKENPCYETTKSNDQRTAHMKKLDHEDALGLRFDSDAGDNGTIRQYLYALLSTLWEEQEGFSGKRPFGNSGWEDDMFRPLIKAGYVDGELDEDGYISKCDHKQGHRVVSELIHFAIYGYVPKTT